MTVSNSAAVALAQVLQEMLDMLRDHQNNSHAARLEWIVIWCGATVIDQLTGVRGYPKGAHLPPITMSQLALQ